MSMVVSETLKVNAILTLLQGCNSLNRLRKLHAHVLVYGLQHNSAIANKLINFCAVSFSGSLYYAQFLFDHIQNPQTQAWNSMIRGFAQSQVPLRAIIYYNRMLKYSASAAPPDTFTFSFTLKSCERIKAAMKCQELHGSIIRSGYQKDFIVCTSLIRSYAANECIDKARNVFDDMSERDLVCWNAMLSCYSQTDLHQEVLELYKLMKNDNMVLDGFSFVALLSSCAHVGALNKGIELHRIAFDSGFTRNVYVGNALIDMYAKCGSLDTALQVFNGMPKKDVLTWNSMIVGFGVHGCGDEAIAFFQQMLLSGFQPNSITFLGVLCGCSHQGLVEKGVEFFHMMSSQFNICPGVKHHGCLVDLYGRAGKLDKALETIHNSQLRKDPVLWRTLLASCKIHGNAEIGEIVMRNLVQLGSSNAGDHMLLAAIYAKLRDADGIARTRKLIKALGTKTSRGWSWVEVGDQVHKFVANDISHPQSKRIYRKLEEIVCRATLAGYVEEEESLILMNGLSAEECVESRRSCHSEKLAIAFALANTGQGTCIRIVKNLRVCRDCHSFTKYVSKAFNRDIVVRDRVRFHHFNGGLCSCSDYW